jgi:diguanylate cyclase (GGDEF)-like protein
MSKGGLLAVSVRSAGRPSLPDQPLLEQQSGASLTSALDEVAYGIVLLDKDLQTRFANRSYYRMLGLEPPPPGKTFNYMDIVELGRAVGFYDAGSRGVDEYAAARIAMIRAGNHPPLPLRSADGRILKTECITLPDGGRMLTFVDMTELAVPPEQSWPPAPIDDLTKLPTRHRFYASLEQEFAWALRHDLPLSVMMVDADRFKQINAQHGRHVGDELLRKLAERLQHRMRRSDILGRLGGEEFAAALPAADSASAVAAAERVRREIASEPFKIGDQRVAVTVSIGVAARLVGETDPDNLLRLADRALCVAKAHGNRVEAERLAA